MISSTPKAAGQSLSLQEGGSFQLGSLGPAVGPAFTSGTLWPRSSRQGNRVGPREGPSTAFSHCVPAGDGDVQDQCLP